MNKIYLEFDSMQYIIEKNLTIRKNTVSFTHSIITLSNKIALLIACLKL